MVCHLLPFAKVGQYCFMYIVPVLPSVMPLVLLLDTTNQKKCSCACV